MNDRLLQHIDITATSLDLAGIEPPPGMQGQVFLGERAAPEREFAYSARDRCDETVDRIRSVRDKRWKLIRNFMPERSYAQMNHYKDTSYPALQVMRQLHAAGELEGAAAQWMAPSRPELELYDLESDPHEVENLAETAEHADKLSVLREKLDAWIEESNDHGRVAEDPLPAEYALRTMVDGWYANNGALRKLDGLLRMEWPVQGRRPREAVVPIVAPEGQMRLVLEIRSPVAQGLEVRWGTPRNMRAAGLAQVDLEPEDGWQTVSADIDCEGWLTQFSIRFPSDAGLVECREATLVRRDGSGTVGKWTFA